MLNFVRSIDAHGLEIKKLTNKDNMPAERYYYPQEFQENAEIMLPDAEAHHLVKVMRNRPGDIVELVNGLGQLAQAEIKQIEKKQCYLEVIELYEAISLDKPLILAQAIPRLNRLEIILEKATELGITEIWLFPSAHSEKKEFSENQSERLRAILISAMKQCGRLFLPDLILMPPLKQWQPFYLPAYFGDTSTDAPLFQEKWKEQTEGKGSIFLVGPESGFTTDEIVILKNLKAAGVKLNNNILRTETAAIAAIALISHWQNF